MQLIKCDTSERESLLRKYVSILNRSKLYFVPAYDDNDQESLVLNYVQ